MQRLENTERSAVSTHARVACDIWRNRSKVEVGSSDRR